jgi:hypothetical protein
VNRRKRLSLEAKVQSTTTEQAIPATSQKNCFDSPYNLVKLASTANAILHSCMHANADVGTGCASSPHCSSAPVGSPVRIHRTPSSWLLMSLAFNGV